MTHRWTRTQLEAALEVSPGRISPILSALIDNVVIRAEHLDALDAAASAKAISPNQMAAWVRINDQYDHYLRLIGLPHRAPASIPTPQLSQPFTQEHPVHD